MRDLIPIEDEPFIQLPTGIDFRRPGQRDPTDPPPLGQHEAINQLAQLGQAGGLASPLGGLQGPFQHNLAAAQQQQHSGKPFGWPLGGLFN